MVRFARRFSVLGVVLLLGLSTAWAQQQQGQTSQGGSEASDQQQTTKKKKTGGQSTASPLNPVTPLSTGQKGNQQNEPNQSVAVQSSATPLTGAEMFTLTHMGAGRSYVIPSLQFAQSVSTEGVGAFGTADVQAVSTLSGLFQFSHVWKRYAFSADYAGTGFLYDRQSERNTSAHEFTFSQRVMGRRSSFLLTDSVTYLPQASFGYSRFNGGGFNNYDYGGLYGVSGGNIDTTFFPSQSILIGPSSRVSNAVIGEYDYRTSPLSSITFTGSYAVLRFPDSAYINSDDAVAKIGYDRMLTPRDSVALSYQAGIFRFGQIASNNFTNHVIEFTYRRTITHRLGFQIGAGPQFNLFNRNLAGQDLQTNWLVDSLLTYQFRRFQVGLSYHHYTSSGSGVYQGAATDYADAQVSIGFSPKWAVNWDLGYARNKELRGLGLSGASNSYNSWYGTINLQRIVSRKTSLFFGYSLLQQLAGQPTCVGPTCGTFYTEQYFSFGLNWHPSRLGNPGNGLGGIDVGTPRADH